MLRSRSAFLLLEGVPEDATVDGPPVLRMQLLTSLSKIGVQHADIEGIECLSKTRWYIVFTTTILRDKYLEQEIELHGKLYKLADPNPPKTKAQRYIRVRIYGYPLDSDPEILEKAIKHYGDLAHINEMYDRVCDIKTGVREAAFTKLHGDIPSYIYAGRHLVRSNYFGQPKTCRKCHKEGHFAKDCTAGEVCKACGEPDHKKQRCPNQRCYHCGEKGHIEHDCPTYYEEFPSIQEATPQNEQPNDDITDDQQTNTSWGGETENEEERPPAVFSEWGDITNSDNEDPTLDNITNTKESGEIPVQTAEFKTPFDPSPNTLPKDSKTQPLPATETDSDSTGTNTDDDEDKEMFKEPSATKRTREQPTNQPPSPSKTREKKKKRRHTPISEAKNRNPFLTN